MRTSDLLYGLLDIKGVGNVKAAKLGRAFAHYLQWSETISEDIIVSILDKYLSQEQITGLIKKRWTVKTKSEYPQVRYINYCQDDFPDALYSLGADCPLQLACMGNFNLLESVSVGFCGSRDASEKGLSITSDVVQQLVEKGIVVVSGYAAGIDMQAHYETLKHGGKTIIVLPEGISYFSIKQALADVWNWDNVLVLSEFAPNAPWSAFRAMRRNGIIVGLSKAMFLIEAKEHSGSMDAGEKTIKQNKALYVPVYENMEEFAMGNNVLLKKGAHPIKKKKDTGHANLVSVFSSLTSLSHPGSLFSL